jgi:aspartyl-tRNA(Asn)/glutamyl-tRNA(Gln) amidotransferase subunit A
MSVRSRIVNAPVQPHTIVAAREALARGETSSAALTEACLRRIADPAGQGSRAFLKVYDDAALACAHASDTRARAGQSLGALDGIPISIKDLFDVAGEPTTAGSIVLRQAAPAMDDAPVVKRLRAAGAVILGKTNMTEFAYSALGTNPHYGTPLAPYDRGQGRVPGGSSAGAAVSVADGMALGTIGTDTGGSTRIPAAFCGITGFKPTRGRVPKLGSFPLSSSFDSIGPMAWDVADCRLLDAVLSGEASVARPLDPRALRFGVATGLPLEGLDDAVATAYEAALARLRDAGASLVPVEGLDWTEALATAAEGRITACECLARHGALFSQRHAYDPHIARRIETAEGFPATAYLKAKAKLERLRALAGPTFSRFDAIVLPTVACVPPRLADVESADGFAVANLRSMRNTFLVNLFDGCAISLPIGSRDGPPVGLMLAAGPGSDAALFDVAACVERLCVTPRGPKT